MRVLTASLCCLLMATACSADPPDAQERVLQNEIESEGEPVAPEPGPTSAPARPAASPAAALPGDGPSRDANVPSTIEGYYRVAGVSGESIDLGWAMTLEIGPERIKLTSQCLQPVWTYRYGGGKLTTSSVPVPVCERGRHPAEEAVMAAIDGADFVVRTPQNAVQLQGDGGSLTLFSQ